jgi:chemotaxis protein MotA
MFVIIGWVVVTVAVILPFALHGGHLGVLWQPGELATIAGAAVGAFVVSTPKKMIGPTLKGFGKAIGGSHANKALYRSLLACLFDVLSKVRKEGLMSIEADIETPDASPLFQKYPEVLKDHHLIEFITDYLRLMVSGNLNPMEIENLMDNEIETHHHEALGPAHNIAKMADGLPAFGIVAAVMGVVHTMESVGIPPSELGMLIAHALVGTFLGILLAYGFVGPLASLLEQKLDESTKMFECVKVTLLASLNGYSPALAVEFGRKVLYSTERPSFLELEQHVKQKK